MCFSAQADIVGGTLVAAIGVDAYRHLRGRSSHLLLATLPVLLGVHQLVEAFVWWGVDGHVPRAVGRVALWTYLLIAFVVLPVFVPFAVLAAPAVLAADALHKHTRATRRRERDAKPVLTPADR